MKAGGTRFKGSTMITSARNASRWLRGRIARLARDARANTVAIMAISLIPLAGMVGGGVDISRMYIVKTRLQHACDAGALAGRKAMGGGQWSQSNYAPRTEAERFFDANYQSDAYGATARTRSFSESAGRVSGTASATLPMTVMRIFGRTEEVLTVNCDAEMRLPNTDVMFVLDVTGSMANRAVSTDADTKIESLRSAVKCFYETVARLNTTESCVGGDPSGGVGNQVQVRFGFVPYSVNVNVGKLLPLSYLANSWRYQSREPLYRTDTTTTWTSNGNAQVTDTDVTSTGNISGESWTDYGTASANSSSACNALATPADSNFTATSEGAPYNQQQGTGNPRTNTWQTDASGWYYRWRYTWNSNSCKLQRRKRDFDAVYTYSQQQTGTTTTTQTFDRYRYSQLTKNVSGLKNLGANSWNNSFQSNVGDNGANRTINWDGCIEERATVRQTSYTPIPAGARDLDIDGVPDPNNADTLWGPMLPNMIFTRQSTSSMNDSFNLATVDTATNYRNNSEYYCPTESRLLQEWDTASTFEAYVDSLQPDGNTYHDIGLLWGARLMSPTGIFRAQNEFTPQGGEIERHLIFMTDGESCTGVSNYTAYGVAWFDRRQTDPNTVPTEGCQTTGTLTQQVNARTAALCTAIKNKNITLWVIWFGAANDAIEDPLEACATQGRYFAARNSTQLQTTFRSIADQISQLRLTR